MARDNGNETSNKSGVARLLLSGALAAASAGVGLLLTAKPERLRQAIDKLSGRAHDLAGELREKDLIGDLKERAESVTSQVGGDTDRGDANDFEARRRERKKRREQRRQRART